MNNSQLKNECNREYSREEALRLLEEGKSESLVRELYPKHVAEIEEMAAAIRMLKALPEIQPSEALLQAALDKMPIKSPFGRLFFFQISFQKAFAALFVLLLLITGGVLARQYVSSQGDTNGQGTPLAVSSENDASDSGIDQDLNSIDTQMQNLNTDNASVDQAMSNQND